MASKFFKKALKAAAGAGAVALALKGIKKKPVTKKITNTGSTIDKKTGKNILVTGDASIATTIADNDRKKAKNKALLKAYGATVSPKGISKMKSGGRVGKMGGGMMKRRMYNKGAFGMLSVKAGIDKNPKPTQADRIAGAKMKNKKR